MPSAPELIEALPIILSLVLIEGLLSVDNALAIAAMASHLPGKQKVLALRWGIIGAYTFRGMALAGAAFIIHNPWVKIIGAAYLVHLTASFFADQHEKERAKEAAETLRELVPPLAGKGFWATVAAIEFMDLSLSVDNVVAAVAMSPKLWVVCTGVFIGILALRYIAAWCIRLIERFPVLESAAFLLIGYVGVILIVELLTGFHVHSFQKFIGVCGIMALSIWYSESPACKSFLKPFLKAARWPLTLYAAVSNGILRLLFLPFRLFIGLFRKRDASAET
jgi:YkoY family integral membrane protein